jgi:agmatine deiminase
MITDRQTNAVSFSARLREYRPFWSALSGILREHGVPFGTLENTRDIWARDFMPVQVAPDRFVQFTFRPKYYREECYQHLQTDPGEVSPYPEGVEACDIVLDGGNLVKWHDKVICTENLFEWNKQWMSRQEVLDGLRRVLGIGEVIVIPRLPYDITGHSDGMLRFVDEKTLLINDFSAVENRKVIQKIHDILKAHGFDLITLPWPVWGNKGVDDRGDYINFLEMEGLIVLPQYGLPEDDAALAIVRESFPGIPVRTIDANEVAVRIQKGIGQIEGKIGLAGPALALERDGQLVALQVAQEFAQLALEAKGVRPAHSG